jgi:hypothetical protein
MDKINENNSNDWLQESRHPLKRISSKLVIAVLVAVLLPFFGLIYFIDTQIDTRLKENIVRQSLLSLAGDLANEANTMMRKRNTDLLLMASDILGDRSILECIREIELLKSQGQINKAGASKTWGPGPIRRWMQEPESDERWYWKTFWRRTQTEMFNQYIRLRKVYDLLLSTGNLQQYKPRWFSAEQRNPHRSFLPELFHAALVPGSYHRENVPCGPSHIRPFTRETRQQ